MSPQERRTPHLERESTVELRQRLRQAITELLPQATAIDVQARFFAYLESLPKGAPNRDARRALGEWFTDRKRHGLNGGPGDRDMVKYLEDLAAYERKRKIYLAKTKQGADEEMNPSRRRTRIISVPAQEVQETTIERKVRHGYTELEETKNVAVPPPSHPDEAEVSPLRLIDVAGTEKKWKEQYQQALARLREVASETRSESDAEGILTRLGKGSRAIQAFLALLTVLFVAAPRGERRYAAGTAQAEDAPSEETEAKPLAQRLSGETRAEQLARARVEQHGVHELSVRLGNGQGRVERFNIVPQTTDGTVRFEVGTHYRRVDLRPGQEQDMQQQVNQIVSQALAPYHQQGVRPDTTNAAIERIEVAMEGTASMEGSKVGNAALINRRLDTTQALVERAISEQGVPSQVVTFTREQGGMRGDMTAMQTTLMQMGVRLRPGERWDRFLGELTVQERTQGIPGVTRLLTSHGASSLDAKAFDELFEQHFRSHRAVGVHVTVHHRSLVVHNDAEEIHQPSPAPEAGSKPVSVTYHNDVYDPRTPVDSPPEQTSGQLYHSTRIVRKPYTYTTEEPRNKTRLVPGYTEAVSEPVPPPVPPPPPVLPTLVYERGKPVAKGIKPGPHRQQKPFKPGGKLGSTYRVDV